MRFPYTFSATVKRLGNYSGKKSSFGAVGNPILGFFAPVDNAQKIAALALIGQAWEFTTDGSKDIQPNDILTIESQDYGVVGVARYRLASQDFLKVTLQIQKNG